MDTTLEITRIGDRVCVVLPDAVLARLRASVGDVLHVIETPAGICITGADPKAAMAERIMHEDRDILRALAK
jgi:bifunctional DNA-binding transcriptional regulator/antitoxin component of YhaV-PrlF toxin-antitoxin module